MPKNPTVFDSIKLTQTIARPANTTDYAAGDVISEVTTNNHYEFTRSDDGNNQLKGSIDYARMTVASNQGTKPDLELWLFSLDIAEVADNAAFAPTDAEMLTLIDIIPFAVDDWYVGLSGGGASGNIAQTKNNLGIIVPQTSGSIYGQLVVRNIYTPIASESFTAEIIVTLD